VYNKMPTYSFQCDEEKGGCSECFERTFSFQEYDDKVKRRLIPCPNCGKRKSVIQTINLPLHVGVSGRTLGVLADRNNAKLSVDHKHALKEKHNAYKEDTISKKLPDGMTRGKDLL